MGLRARLYKMGVTPIHTIENKKLGIMVTDEIVYTDTCTNVWQLDRVRDGAIE